MGPLRTVQKYMNINIDSLNKNVHYIRLKKSFTFCGFVFLSERSLFSVLSFPPFWCQSLRGFMIMKMKNRLQAAWLISGHDAAEENHILIKRSDSGYTWCVLTQGATFAAKVPLKVFFIYILTMSTSKKKKKTVCLTQALKPNQTK